MNPNTHNFCYQRREWERKRQIAVFSTERQTCGEKPRVMSLADELLRELRIPVCVVDGDKTYARDAPRVRRMLSKSTKADVIDHKNLVSVLAKSWHRDHNTMPYGIVILLHERDDAFVEYPDDAGQPAIYGVGYDDGLVLLAHKHRAAVRHEIAHMLGLQHHEPPKPGCIMNWCCCTDVLCKDCREEIRKIWQGEIVSVKSQAAGRKSQQPSPKPRSWKGR